MKIFAIGDLHLSLSGKKPMDIFGGWKDYVRLMTEQWNAKISPEDLVVLAGDISWGMSLEESLEDFRYIHQLPGQKYLMKGNHDYWWNTRSKTEAFFQKHSLDSLHILHNNAVETPELYLCGTRGWIFEKGEPHDVKIVQREAARLEMSLQSAGGKQCDKERVVFLHYPPVYGEEISAEIIDVLLKYNVKRCYYGHIHGPGIRYALNGTYLGIEFRLISSDALGFSPIRIDE